MARTWLSVTVELLGGRGEEPWPPPGRVFAVGPMHTFADLADAINEGFARWDRSHMSLFTLADRRVIADASTGAAADAAASTHAAVPIPTATPASTHAPASTTGAGPVLLPISTTLVADTVALGEEFQFTYDLGDNWMHRCVVGAEPIDPHEKLGVVPDRPTPYWGWGSIPDQYGRQWSDDDGQSAIPERRTSTDPMLTDAWPGRRQLPSVDMQQVRQAIATDNAAQLMFAITVHDIDDGLQQIAQGVPLLLASTAPDAASMVRSLIAGLTARGGPGDQVRADDLSALVRGEEPPGRIVDVDVESLAEFRERGGEFSTGGYIDLTTGRLYLEDDTAALTAHEEVIDPDADPDRWLHYDCIDSRTGWQDMADFAARQHDAALRGRLEQAIEGRGAFRRFHDLVHENGLAEQWTVFSDDRQLGRTREFLADAGIRVP